MLLRIALLFTLSFPTYAMDTSNTIVGWYSVLPPIVAIVLAFLTKRIFLSLALATLSGSFIAVNANYDGIVIIGALFAFLNTIFGNLTDPWNLKVISFVLCILAMISLVIISGGFSAIVKSLSTWANNRQRTQLVTFFAGLLVFIDDYANTMIVGSSMRPISDQHKISREKLAFIIDATAAPVAGLAIVSTWIGYEVGLFSDSAEALQLNIDGYTIFLDALGFRFYCILMLCLVLISILRQKDFGKMYYAEIRAINTGDLMAKDARPPSTKAYSISTVDDQTQAKIRNALIPFAILFFVLFSGLWIDGGGMLLLKESIFSILNPINWLDVIQKTENSSTILLSSAMAGLISAILTSFYSAKTSFSSILNAIKSGIKSSLTPISILILAWSLKSVCNDLNTADYLVEQFTPYLSPAIFPLMIFFIAGLTAFGTGTSWGTMAILIPIAFPVAFALDNNSYGLITIICMAAVLDGAIFGDHCSPISDTTIMSSISSHCDHIHHVQTQLPYALLVGGIAMVLGYLPAVFETPIWLSYLMGILFIYFFLSFFGRSTSSKA